MTERYRPNVTVACVIYCQQHYLVVEEIIDGEQRFNQPAGHLEAHESLELACCREVFEETGLKISPSHLVGIYQFSASPELAFLRFTFALELTEMTVPAPQDSQIRAAHWLDYASIVALKDKLRSPLVLKSIDDFRQGQHIDLSLLNCDDLI
ncbi:MAG: NUDIX hydrolase [Shewanella sp.]